MIPAFVQQANQASKQMLHKKTGMTLLLLAITVNFIIVHKAASRKKSFLRSKVWGFFRCWLVQSEVLHSHYISGRRRNEQRSSSKRKERIFYEKLFLTGFVFDSLFFLYIH